MLMDKRTILIVIALVLPLVALLFLSQTGNQPAPPAEKPGTVTATPNRLPATDGIARNNPRRPPASLEEARQRVKQRLQDLEKMTPEQWEQEQAERRAMGRRDRMGNDPKAPVQRMPDLAQPPAAPAAGPGPSE
jgi:hypothetical protein